MAWSAVAVRGSGRWGIGARVGVVAVVLGGCAQSDTVAQPATTTPRTLTVLTPYFEGDAPAFERELAAFTEETGIEVEVRGEAGDFVDALTLDVDSERAPDLAVIPQPGIVEELVARGSVLPLPDELAARTQSQVLPAFARLATVDGAPVSTWVKVSTSGFFHRADILEARGWKVPTTMAEFEDLLSTASEAGITPLCVGIQAGGASGWSLTDWVEAMVLNDLGPAAYDRWMRHELDFGSPELLPILERLSGWMTDPTIVAGGPSAIRSTPVEDAIIGLTGRDPKCLMTYGSSWILASIDDQLADGAVRFDAGEGAMDGPTIAQFPFPPSTAGVRAATVGGDQLVSLRDDPAAWALIEHVASSAWGEQWAAMGGFVSANIGFDPDAYSNPEDRRTAELLQRAEVARFDASDAMPAEVGSGAFWTGMIDVVEGVPPEQVADEIDTAWP